MPSKSTMMQVIFTVCVALLFAQSATAGALTNASITLSNQLASATGVTATIKFTAATAMTTFGSIVIGFAPMGFKPTTGKVEVGTSGTFPFQNVIGFNVKLSLATYSWAVMSDTLTIDGFQVPEAGAVSFTITGLQNPTSVQLAKSNISITTYVQGSTVDTTSTGSLSAITAALPSSPSITLGSYVYKSLTSATFIFTPTTTGPASIAVNMDTYTGSTLAVTVSGGAAATSTGSVVASFLASGVLSVSGFTLSATPSTIVVYGLINPDASSYKLQLMVQSVANSIATDKESAMVDIPSLTYAKVSKVGISTSSQIASTSVNVTIAFNSVTVLTGGKIVVSVPGLATAAAASLSVVSLAGVTFATGATAEITAVGTPAINTLTVTGATLAAFASASFTVKGVVNLGVQVASKYNQVKTQSSSSVDVDDSGFLESITFPAILNALGSPSFSLSSYVRLTDGVYAVVSFTPTTSVSAGILLIAGATNTLYGNGVKTNVTGVTCSFYGGLMTLSGVTTTAGIRYFIQLSGISTPSVQDGGAVAMKLQTNAKIDQDVGYTTLPAITVTQSAAPALNQGLAYLATAGAAIAALLM